MRTPIAAAALLVAACATVPPMRPVDPSQAVAKDPSAAAALAAGVRLVVHPEAWAAGAGDLEAHLTAIEVAIENGSDRALQIRPATFSLRAPDGMRYDALAGDELRRVFGPYGGRGYGWAYYGAYPWGPYPWSLHRWGGYPGGIGGAYGPWWSGHPVYPGRVPARALAQGALDPGGKTSVLLFFPVPAASLTALELNVTLVDTSGRSVAEVRVPFAREGHRPTVRSLPPIAAPPSEAPAQPPPAEPGAPAPWETVPTPSRAPPG